MKKGLMGVICFCVSMYSSTLLADNDLVSSQLRNIMAMHAAASSQEAESLDDLMKTMHAESPAYMQIKTQMEQVFPVFDMDVALEEFSFIGIDGDYAISRVKLKMKKISGPMFQDHVAEQIFVFKQDHGQWKIWQAAILSVKFL